MANVTIQSMIPLAGKGHAYRLNGGYTAGEYKQLVNCELNDLGYIVSRRGIHLCGMNTVDENNLPPYYQCREFLGHSGQGAIVGFNNGQRAVYGDPDIADKEMWNIDDLDPGGDSYDVVKKFIRYNGQNYWISHFKSGTICGFRVRYSQEAEDVPDNTGVIDLTTVTGHSVSVNLEAAIDNQIKNAFMHKERMWVALGNAVYFSKPTDPSVWAVPDGGFFKFNEARVNYALASRDSVYVICDSSIYVITYSADPNLDAVVIKIDDSGGGDYATVYNGNVYYVKDDSLNVITNNNVSRVMDLNLGFWGEEGNYTKLHAFGEYIVIQKHTYRSYDEFGHPDRREALKHPVSLSQYTTNDPSCYFVNMITGAIHALDFSDSQPDNNPGYVADVMLVPREDKNNNTYLYLLTKNSLNQGRVYAMPITGPDTRYEGADSYIPACDYIRGSDDRLKRVNHHVRIEIDSFVPDGTEYLMKKFRTLLISAKFPYGGSTPSQDALALQIKYDGRAYGPPMVLEDKVHQGDVDTSPPYPHRYPMNQRGRSISILIEQEPDYDDGTSIRQDMLIEDIRLFWSYTSRMPTKRSKTNYYDTI